MNKIPVGKKPDKTDWHRLWGMMVSPLFERLGCTVTVEMDLSAKVQRLDMTVVTRERPLRFDDVDPAYYQGFENLNDHNLISFKSFHEVFNTAAMEELYGHLTNYKKIMRLKQTGNINLYAVTHHFPDDLFCRFKGTGLIDCVLENRIYDLNVFTPVRFIITRSFDHPILGLFSNNVEQILKSRHRLESDGWLLEYVSSYLKKLYEYYSLEGVDMPYTKEMFVKEHFPEYYDQFLLAQEQGMQKGIEKGMQKGIEKGMQKGELIGGVLLFQQILKKPISAKSELLEKNLVELQALYDTLEKEWMVIKN